LRKSFSIALEKRGVGVSIKPHHLSMCKEPTYKSIIVSIHDFEYIHKELHKKTKEFRIYGLPSKKVMGWLYMGYKVIGD
jgi:hypothetical protein